MTVPGRRRPVVTLAALYGAGGSGGAPQRRDRHMGSTTARHLSPPIELHPDRLLPADPGTRTIARRLYEQVRDLPVIAPHGHVDPALLLNDRPFPDPATLLVTPDHYVTRLLHADGAAAAFRRHMLLEMARMSCEDGLVMTLHPAVRRNHHDPTFERYGADVGADIPTRVEFTDALRPLLRRYGTHPGFHLVVFTLDETVWSRELAPLSGFYPSVYIGVPWWFLDAPDAILRFRVAVTEIAGFSRTSGFVDDTRAFCSIPARHDMSRRIDAGFLARLVAEHRLGEPEAADIAVHLVSGQPKAVFKL
jgi:glucuronate isomerase